MFSQWTMDMIFILNKSEIATGTLSAMNFSEITVNNILLAIFKTSNKLLKTPDGIPGYFLKHVAPSINDVLCYLFNLSC